MYFDHYTSVPVDEAQVLRWSGIGEVVAAENVAHSDRQSWETMVGSPWARVLAPSTVGSKLIVDHPPQDEVVDAVWFSESLARLDELRDKADSHRLSIAEVLVAHFAVWPAARRPSISEDPDGNPHFSARSGDYYLHLSIEDDDSLNWYAKLNGQEFFGDDDRIYGARLSAELNVLARV